jgi:hypothetical protein
VTPKVLGGGGCDGHLEGVVWRIRGVVLWISSLVEGFIHIGVPIVSLVIRDVIVSAIS